MKNRQYFKFFTILLAVLTLIFGIYSINNYNQFHTYVFQGSEESFRVSGNAIFTKQIRRLHIDDIKYQGTDILIQKIKISLFAKIENKDRLIYASEKKSDTLFSLTDYLNQYSYGILEQYGYDEYFDSAIIKNFKDVMYLKIELVDELDHVITKTIKLNSEKYSNNQWFYKKVNHI